MPWIPTDSRIWAKLRSAIYIRDRGICWLCNEFVELKDYELGHLVDKADGGCDIESNLAVMHEHCNLLKPSHQTLEDAKAWRDDYQKNAIDSASDGVRITNANHKAKLFGDLTHSVLPLEKQKLIKSLAEHATFGVRKLIRLGGSYAVVIPVVWVKYRCAEIDGDYYFKLNMDGNTLILEAIDSEDIANENI